MEKSDDAKMIRACNAHTDRLPELMNEWIDAWSNDLQKLLMYYHPDALYYDPSLPEPIQGQQAIRSYFGALFRNFPGWKWEITELFLTAKGCTVKWKALFPIDGRNVTLKGLDIVEMEGDKIIRNEVYFDRTELLKALYERDSHTA